MEKLDRRKFIKKSILGIGGVSLIINTISCINGDDMEVIIEPNINYTGLPDKIYIVNYLQKKIIKSYNLNDENKVDLSIKGVILKKNKSILNKINNTGLKYDEFGNSHIKIFFEKESLYSITKNLNKNIVIHYILEEPILEERTNNNSIVSNIKSFNN